MLSVLSLKVCRDLIMWFAKVRHARKCTHHKDVVGCTYGCVCVCVLSMCLCVNSSYFELFGKVESVFKCGLTYLHTNSTHHILFVSADLSTSRLRENGLSGHCLFATSSTYPYILTHYLGYLLSLDSSQMTFF